MNKWLLLAAGGILGTIARYLLSGASSRWFGAGFSWGTMAVNLVGCFAIGFLALLADKKLLLGPDMRLFLMTGFLGAFTTFSALIYESWGFIEKGQMLLAGTNLLGSVVLGLAAFWLGLAVASIL